jgi:predicted RNA methylase
MHRPSEFAATLLPLKTDLEAQLQNTHPTMVQWVANSIERRNAVIDLCNGIGEFADAFEQPDAQGHYATGYDPKQADVLAEALVQHLRGTAWWSRQDPEVVKFFLGRIAQNDKTHPFVANWKTWAMDTIDPRRAQCPAWPEVAAA